MKTIYVDSVNRSGLKDGKTPETAFRTLQDAIDIANYGDGYKVSITLGKKTKKGIQVWKKKKGVGKLIGHVNTLEGVLDISREVFKDTFGDIILIRQRVGK